MNQHGRHVERHWRAHRPASTAHLQDREAFFTAAGEEIQNRIAQLTPQLAGPDLPGEDSLAKVARLSNARARATEMALSDSGLFTTSELTRDEWEWTTQEHSEGLISWAYRMQEQADGWVDHGLTVEDAADRYLLPETFLREMVSSSSPRRFLETHPQEWEESVEARWARDSQTG
ncbi:hypothetical protein [Microbacterium immunditiarum]|uniref:Uncharacterized protein n=1 Tax=Microbacterium immunditiarum TaxID=337480 RepID=A0A7Y9KJG4_9MICO|nr:hypothetical protein [Microbacterium immunditiarum]NYE18113.1 hypothetical protein [Microbacterium immunditiarum]